MEIVFNILGFIIAFIIAMTATTNILLTVFKQVPFVKRLKTLGVIHGGSIYTLYFFRVLIAVAVIIVLFNIPFASIAWGTIFGVLVALRGVFDRTLKNDMYVDFVNGLRNSRAIVDEDNVAALGYRAMMDGKIEVTYGLSNKILTNVFARLLPYRWQTAIVARASEV